MVLVCQAANMRRKSQISKLGVLMQRSVHDVHSASASLHILSLALVLCLAVSLSCVSTLFSLLVFLPALLFQVASRITVLDFLLSLIEPLSAGDPM